MPTVIIPDKICTHCGGNKWNQSINKGVTKFICRNKISEYNRNRLNKLKLDPVRYNEVARQHSIYQKVNKKRYYPKLSLEDELLKIAKVQARSLKKLQDQAQKEKRIIERKSHVRKVYVSTFVKLTPDERKSRSTKKYLENRDTISDAYVKGCLYKFSKSSLITPQQIERFREHLKTQRLCRQ